MPAIKLDFSKFRYTVTLSDTRFPDLCFPPAPYTFSTPDEAEAYKRECIKTAKEREQPWFTFGVFDNFLNKKVE